MAATSTQANESKVPRRGAGRYNLVIKCTLKK